MPYHPRILFEGGVNPTKTLGGDYEDYLRIDMKFEVYHHFSGL